MDQAVLSWPVLTLHNPLLLRLDDRREVQSLLSPEKLAAAETFVADAVDLPYSEEFEDFQRDSHKAVSVGSSSMESHSRRIFYVGEHGFKSSNTACGRTERHLRTYGIE